MTTRKINDRIEAVFTGTKPTLKEWKLAALAFQIAEPFSYEAYLEGMETSLDDCYQDVRLRTKPTLKEWKRAGVL